MSTDYGMLIDSEVPANQLLAALERRGLGSSTTGMILALNQSYRTCVATVLGNQRLDFSTNIILAVGIDSSRLHDNKRLFLQNALSILELTRGPAVLYNTVNTERPLIARMGPTWLDVEFSRDWIDLDVELNAAEVPFSFGELFLDMRWKSAE